METETYTQIKHTVKKLLNIDLSYYKEEQVKRRLDSWLIRSNSTDWGSYFRIVTENPIELSRFRDYLTINVTEFFRDPKQWQYLQDNILPTLRNESNGRSYTNNGLKIWSAGCSIGVEAYTLTMIMEGLTSKPNYQIIASDMDRGALQKAKARGPYHQDEVRNLSQDQLAKFMDNVSGHYFVKEKVAQKVKFFEQDLLQDKFDGGFDLIVCRNVIIYFTQEAKNILYNKFQQALRPGGILFLGGTELIPRPVEYGFSNAGISFYTKV